MTCQIRETVSLLFLAAYFYSMTFIPVAAANDGTSVAMTTVVTANMADNSPTTTKPEVAKSGSTKGKNTSILCDHLEKQESTTPSCFPGFECIHGRCTAGMSCECDEGWAGMFCQHECPTDCGSLGKCGTSGTGEATCYCSIGFTYSPDNGCVLASNETTTETPVTTPANLRPVTDRECFYGFVCVYGYCQIGSIVCVCDDGWIGPLCDQPCDFDCRGNGVCKEDEEKGIYCDCKLGYYGDHCEVTPYGTEQGITTPSQNDSGAGTPTINYDQGSWGDLGRATESTSLGNTTEMTTTFFNMTTSSNVTTASVLRPLDQRECIPGFVCEHGKCAPDSEGIACVCDEGWAGVLCHLVCDLDCGQNSTCVASDGVEPYCKCRFGYSCNQDIKDSPKENITATPANTSESSSVGNTTLPLIEMWEPLNGHEALLSLELRFCVPGFVCRYGNCSQVEPFECYCQKGFSGTMCEDYCPLDCGANAKCQLKDTGPGCSCDYPYTGPSCSEFIPFDEDIKDLTWWPIAVGACGVAIVAGAGLLYLLWRKQNITMMKFVYWFQNFEDDDQRKYDAFVSYSSADWDWRFVVHTLVPRLETGMLFNICLHQRNWGVGLPILENIQESVRQSRRTLLVISPSYLESKWCAVECQVAFDEMLENKHRIIPVIVGDISDNKEKMNDTMKHLLKSVTYLEYPKRGSTEKEINRFWERLQLSMPKKRSDQVESPSPHHSQLSANSRDLLSPYSHGQSKPTTPTTPTTPTYHIGPDNKGFANGLTTPPPLLKQIVRVPASDFDTETESSFRSHSGCFHFFGRGSPSHDRMSDDTSSDPDFLPPSAHNLSQPLHPHDLNQIFQPSMATPPHEKDVPDLSDKRSKATQVDSDALLSINRNFLGNQSLGSLHI